MVLARKGEAEGIWLRAERQYSGRGRQGRAWESTQGNLLVSTLVRLGPDDPPAASLALMTSLALLETVRAFLPQTDPSSVTLKWPNDLLLGGAKVSGILLEREGNAVVIGIGVNLAQHPDSLDRPVTSLAAHGIAPPADVFLRDLIDHFSNWLDRWRTDGLEPMQKQWLDNAHALGSALTIHDPAGTKLDGEFDGLTDDGALRLRLADGSVHVMHAGDVFLV